MIKNTKNSKIINSEIWPRDPSRSIELAFLIPNQCLRASGALLVSSLSQFTFSLELRSAGRPESRSGSVHTHGLWAGQRQRAGSRQAQARDLSSAAFGRWLRAVAPGPGRCRCRAEAGERTIYLQSRLEPLQQGCCLGNETLVKSFKKQNQICFVLARQAQVYPPI